MHNSKSKLQRDILKDADPGQTSPGKVARVALKREDIVPAPITDPDKAEHVEFMMRNLFEDEDNTMSIVCSFVANGGSIINLCKTWDISYSTVLKWIREDDGRQKRYDRALSDRSEWTIEQVLKELRTMALSDIRQLYDENNCLKPVAEWPTDIAKAVEAVKVDEIKEDGVVQGETKQVKLWSKVKAIELLGKHLQLFIDRLEVSGTMKLEELVAASYSEKDKE